MRLWNWQQGRAVTRVQATLTEGAMGEKEAEMGEQDKNVNELAEYQRLLGYWPPMGNLPLDRWADDGGRP